MPDKRHHRGLAPGDAEEFASDQWPRLHAAAADLSWLLTRGYARDSSLKLAGDRYALTARQRVAIGRCAASDQACANRRNRETTQEQLRGHDRLSIDGFNVLLTLETAFSGGILLQGRDGCIRDMANVHGSYRSVEETVPVLELIGRTLQELGISTTVWYLDRPVSNSGRLKQLLTKTAATHDWNWSVELVFDPDRELATATGTVVTTADSAVLDRCGPWFNLVRHILASTPAVRPPLELG